jgi:hypothetical protein
MVQWTLYLYRDPNAFHGNDKIGSGRLAGRYTWVNSRMSQKSSNPELALNCISPLLDRILVKSSTSDLRKFGPEQRVSLSRQRSCNRVKVVREKNRPRREVKLLISRAVGACLCNMP